MPDPAGAPIVDVHTHVVPRLPDLAMRLGDDRWPTFAIDGEGEAAVGRLSRGGSVVRSVGQAAWDMAARIGAMDALGVDRHVLSPLPPIVCDWGEPADATSWARAVNESIAELAAFAPDRFTGFGMVSLHHPELAVAELEHARALGLAGVEIGTSGGGREFDDPQLRDFFAAAADLGMRLYIHPLIMGASCGWTDRIVGQEVTFGLGMGTDTAIAAAKLAFGGVAAAYPRLQVCLAHGGGTFFWALARLARLWDRPDRPDAERTKALTAGFVADSVLYDPRNVAYLVEAVGAERVLFGTDFPLPAQDDLTGGVLRELAEHDRAAVLGANALRWLGLA